MMKGYMMSKIAVKVDGGPPAGGPYSPAIIANGFVFTAGQVGLIPGRDEPVLVDGGIEEQTTQAFKNIEMVLQAAGSGLDKIVKTTVYLADIADFQRMNAVYATFFQNDPPARTTFQVGALPMGALIEIETIALA
jgi:2-iminobutanoate/2-iminopropanoate deaminase